MIEIKGLSDLIGVLRKFSQKFRRRAKRPVKSFADDTTKQVTRHLTWRRGRGTDTGGLSRGRLRRSINADIEDNHRGLQASIQPHGEPRTYAPHVEFGTKPHFPPLEALATWARMHGTTPYVVARGIAKHGTEGRHMFERGYKWARKNSRRLTTRLGAIAIDIMR